MDVFALDLFLTGVKASQFEQRLGEPPHLLGGVQAGFDRFAVFAGAAFSREGCLGLGDDDGKRRAELVGGIGGKLPLLRKSSFEPGEGGIQNASQSSQFVVGVGPGNAFREVARGDAAGRSTKFLPPTKGACREPPPPPPAKSEGRGP